MTTFEHRSRVEAPAEDVFAWHCRPGAFERLTPPWENVRVLEREGGIAEGGRVVMDVRKGLLTLRWVARHTDYQEGRQFADVQLRGPFAAWRHLHRFVPDGDDCILDDRIEYRLSLGWAGELLGGASVRRTLERAFHYRHERTRRDMARHRAVAQYGPQRVAVTGASGLIGGSLTAFLESGGHRVQRLVRRRPRAETNEVYWDPASATIDSAALEGVDAVVHLAGASVGDGIWTSARKEAILRSRVDGTRLLCQTLARLTHRPRVVVAASAIGYYGDRGDELLTEESAPGDDFLARVAMEWESATEPARQAGIRVVNLRIGFALSAAGGGLPQLLLPFRLGLGGVVGSGRQYMSWIAFDDLIGAIYHAMFAEGLSGPVNAVAPTPATNAELSKTLGRVLRRPAVMPLPAFAVRLAAGEMGEALLLSGQRVLPARLEQSGFRFLHADLEGALSGELGLA